MKINKVSWEYLKEKDKNRNDANSPGFDHT